MRTHIGQVIMSTTLNTAAKVHAIYGGTWEAWGQGRVPVGVDPNDADFNAPNKTGGSKTVTLTLEQIPSHSHEVYGRTGNTAAGSNCFQGRNWSGTAVTTNTDSRGGGGAHENMPPYQTLYLWRRTA